MHIFLCKFEKKIYSKTFKDALMIACSMIIPNNQKKLIQNRLRNDRDNSDFLEFTKIFHSFIAFIELLKMKRKSVKMIPQFNDLFCRWFHGKIPTKQSHIVAIVILLVLCTGYLAPC